MGFLSSPDLQKFSLDFALKHANLTWADILWGYEHELFYWFDVVEIAKIKVKDLVDFEEYDLAFSLTQVSKSCIWKVSEILPKLAVLSHSDTEHSKQKFLYLALAWGYENRHKYENPLDAVSYIFADFDYPDEISHFVPFIPPTDGFDPSKYSRKEIYQRLLNLWREYLRNHGYKDNETASI